VLESRHGARMLVNQKSPGDVFGELSLLYTTPRSATVQASRCLPAAPPAEGLLSAR
jgi:CRP-like cAMP-binding protein